MNLLAAIYELLEDVRMLHESPPRGYTVEETEARLMERLGEIAKDADGLQMDMAVAYDGLLGVVEARMRAMLESSDD